MISAWLPSGDVNLDYLDKLVSGFYTQFSPFCTVVIRNKSLSPDHDKRK